jgi:hypothetical protein
MSRVGGVTRSHPGRFRASMAAALPLVGLLLMTSGGAALARPPETGRFSFVDDFYDNACGFPIHLVHQVDGTFQAFFDAQGVVTKVMVHQHWSGTDTANGKSIFERGAVTDAYDFVAGEVITQTETGQIHGMIPRGVQDGHDRGLIVFDLVNGPILTEHGQHPGADSGGTAGCGAFL